MKHALKLAICATLLLLGQACTSTAPGEQAERSASTSPSLEGTSWQAEDIDRGGIIDMSNLTLEFDNDNRIAGMAGCNRYFGTASISSAEITLSSIGVTRMACPPALMQQEDRFLAGLQEATRFEIQDDLWLVLYDAEDNQRIKFIRREVNQPPEPQDKALERATSFNCDGSEADMRFLGPETIELVVGDETHILQQARAASGARYVGKGVEFWNKGDEAMLIREEVRLSCTRATS